MRLNHAPTRRRRSFARWLRETSEQQLMIAAQRKMARRYGAPPPSPPHGIDLFWQRVYAPAFYVLPYPVRAKIASRMPGSHRRTWHQPAQGRGPAV
jgi:hypothetical protein